MQCATYIWLSSVPMHVCYFSLQIEGLENKVKMGLALNEDQVISLKCFNSLELGVFELEFEKFDQISHILRQKMPNHL